MLNAENIVHSLANAFNIPIIEESTHIWFFRTQSGKYYFDFHFNNYIALGWDLVSSDLISDKEKTETEKKEAIAKLYPDEKRPGLIYSQMDSFYRRMAKGDLVVIPDFSGRRIAIGTLEDITSEIKHKYLKDEYDQCEYKHKRSVKWIKQIEWWADVYLFRVLRAQQTISDITQYSDMVYRNLHPCYITDSRIHLTLIKTTTSDFRVQDSLNLQLSVLQINKAFADYFGTEDTSGQVTIKTAVGSPGFMEMGFPTTPASVLTAVWIGRAIVGKTTTKDGEVSTGLMAILSKGNELANDHCERKKVKAEINQIEAETKKTAAETALIEAQARKTLAEAQAIELANQKEQAAIKSITESTKTLILAASHGGIELDKKLDNVS